MAKNTASTSKKKTTGQWKKPYEQTNPDRIVRGHGLPDLLLPTEPSTIGRDKIEAAVAAVIARRKSR
jgi:hypothetical protein